MKVTLRNAKWEQYYIPIDMLAKLLNLKEIIKLPDVTSFKIIR